MKANAREMEEAHRCLNKWARWCNTDELGVMGYPSSTSEQRTVYSLTPGEQLRKIRGERWGSNPKNSRSAKTRCPDWDVEMETEAIMNSLHVHHQRVLHCEYEVMLDSKKIARFAMSVRKLHLLGHNGKYTWPRFKHQRIDAVGMGKTKYYEDLQSAVSAFVEHSRFREMLARRIAA